MSCDANVCFRKRNDFSLKKRMLREIHQNTSKMDSEKFYHTQGDELGTLDMKNMAEIIKSIALSAKTIIAGTDTPSRVDATQLR